MKYRTKLYISLVSIAFISIVLGLIITSIETEKLIFRMLQSRSLSIVTTAAAQIDPEVFEKGTRATSIKDPSYIELKSILKKIIYANRRNDIYLSDAYTLYVDPTKPGKLFNGVDVTRPTSSLGTPYEDHDKDRILANYKHPYVEPTFIQDQLGLWLSSFAPIVNKQGKIVGILGIDINARDIHTKVQQLIKFGIWGLISSIALSLIIAHFLSKRVTVSLDHITNVVQEIGSGNLDAKAELNTNDEFEVLCDQVNAMCKGLQERERLKMSFARYVSTHIMEKIIHSDTPLKLEGERRKVTLLFSDIRQFTKLAENLAPEAVVQLLNEYFERMIEVIFAHSGTLDKFIGDGIMAEFGAPLDDEAQEEHAIRAAIEMQNELKTLSSRWEKENKPRIEMGIGIHTGEAVVGNIGSERRIEYTAIGDAVNVASRLEQATKILKAPILLSETTYLGAKDKFAFKDLGSMALPGRKEQIKVYTIET